MANTTQALWIVIIALSVSCAILLSLVIKSSYFKNQNNSTDIYGGYYGKVYPPEAGTSKDGKSSTKGDEKETQTDSPTSAELWQDFRLSPHVIPIHYDLLLNPDVLSENFTGQVDITVNVTKSIGAIIVHKYKTLNILNSSVTLLSNGNLVPVNRSFEYVPNEFWVVQAKEDLVAGEAYVVRLTFGGPLTGSIVGLYKSTYTNKKLNKTSAIVSSKFQPTFARRAFPCFDEPNWKSTFTVTLIHDENAVALSNMPVQNSEKLENNLMKTSFEKSVPMVTYLVCFVIGDYKYLSTFTKSGTEFRVYATPDQIEDAQYALDLGSQVLSYFEEYFVIPYPLPKQDMVAIPDFVSGAMEHWGLITYRETNLLFNEKESSSVNKQRVASVVAHELAHMWFGNLVTMEWWDDLWLNEGFASYLEYKGVIDYEKNWDMAAQFLTSDLQPVMSLDSKVSSHPIIQTVHHPDQITEIFDRISYSKGASVLRMLEHFMGPKDFQMGVQIYLTEYEYGNAKTEDLWQKLSKSSTKGYNITSIMRSWTKQKGFPVITISRDGANGFIASQKQYFESAIEENGQGQIWQVPLSYISAESQHEEMVWMNSSGPTKFAWNLADSNSWIKFNYKQNGFYIVNYDLPDWLKLQTLLEENHLALSPEDRSNLLHDVIKLAAAGHVGYDLALNFTKYLVKETHYVPWRTAYNFFADLLSYLSGSSSYSDLKKYIINLTTPLMAKLGWEDSGSHLDKLLRSVIIKLSCKSGHEECLNEASQLFKNWMKGKTIHPNLRNRVYEFGMEQNGHQAWEYMWGRYRNETSAQEKTKLLYGMSKTRIPWLLTRFLKMSEDENNVKRQDYFTVLRYVASNPTGRPIAWMYLRENWLHLVDRFTLNERYLGRAVKSIVQGFKSTFRLNEAQEFFRKYPEAGSGRRGRKQAIEEVESKIKWLKANEKTVDEWLEAIAKNF